ncbi:MAG TPA: anhydro-N-acetylmuramic acid kinase [Candidatus Rubrimentiphilum sp.]|nr:anhydro-N-acetylmuramic acid kinase [Candidatus Rubrimentiphilum sp.]
MIAIGLMSGTSLDGVDAALVRLVPRGRSYEVDVLDFQTTPYAQNERSALDEALPPNEGSTRAVARLHCMLGRTFAKAALNVAGKTAVDFVASHGQTIFHDGDAQTTLQVGDPFVIRQAVGSTVCYDFRSADCAAGGHGAPLVPYVDALLLASDSEDRVAVNVGGIANLTVIPRRSAPQDVVAYDSGPGNMLIDAFIFARTNGRQSFDRDGKAALAGSANRSVLDAMLGDPYFSLAPPRTTGRERFGAQFLKEHQAGLDALSIEDGAATLVALTAASLAAAIDASAAPAARVVVSGGGAKNPAILRELQQRLPDRRVETSDVMNIRADAKEAVAFAILGYETLRGRAANVPRSTGANGPAVLGAIAPHGLDALLEKLRAECPA